MIQPLIRLQKSIARLCAQERGAVLVYVALMLPLLIGMAALAIDGSNLFAQQRRIQTAADAAALAGAQRLALGGSLATAGSDAQSLATANDASSVTWQAIDSNTGLQVTVVRTFNTFFAGSIGYHTFTVQATAAAHYLSVSGTGNLLPMTIKKPLGSFVYGQAVTLWDDDKDAPGSFGWLTWNGSPSAKTLEENIANPSNSNVWHIGDLIPAASGVMNASGVWSALAGWTGKAVTIPVYDIMVGGKYRISGFAEFIITSTSKKDKLVIGTFTRTLSRSDSVGGGASDYGLRDVRMTQ